MTATETNVFTAGIPLEHMAPAAHQKILSAARHLAYAQLNPNTAEREMEWANRAARDAAERLHTITKQGSATMWLQIVRYAAELHSAALVARGRQ